MSAVREEDRQKNSCPSRGFGIAAAAIGVGVGAALYYFFNKRQENPNSEGSTSNWNCERAQTFHVTESDDSYTTISEHETTDTSMNDTASSLNHTASSLNHSWTSEASIVTIESSSDDDSALTADDDNSISDTDTDSYVISNDVYLSDSTYENGYLSLQNVASSSLVSDSEVTEWDITTSSIGLPEDRARSPIYMLLDRIRSAISPRRRKTEEQQINNLRQQAFRERSWTLEECSICFDVMLRNQDVMSLPCAHNFHSECIMPWLQEKQTCPICRKVAE